MPIFPILPSLPDWTFKPVFDIRERIERRLEKDFNESVPDNRSDLTSRLRAGFDFSYKNQYTGRVMYQYGHTLYWSPAKNASEWRSDIFLAYVDAKTMEGTLRLGRQNIFISSQRLLGQSDWGITGRSYDGARWTGKGWDVFAGRLSVNGTPSKDATIAGALHSGKYGDTLYVYRHDEKSASHIDLHTLDHVWKFKSNRWSGSAEGAIQTGRTGDRKQEAWAAAVRADYASDSKTTLYFEGAAASGGGDAETSRTFDQYYATLHSKHGIMDMQGWRNMTGITLGVNHKPTPKLSLTGEFHKFGLFDASDAWYGDGGGANKGFVDPTGNSGKDVGQELDLYASYSLDAKSQLEGGFGVFMPGDFVKSFPGRNDKQFWGYLQYRIRF